MGGNSTCGCSFKADLAAESDGMSFNNLKRTLLQLLLLERETLRLVCRLCFVTLEDQSCAGQRVNCRAVIGLCDKCRVCLGSVERK